MLLSWINCVEVSFAARTRDVFPKQFARFYFVFLSKDDSGNAVLESQGAVKEAIGRGENGLRVEVSLKYRRLLVQKLAKESLVSAKDHDNFR